MYETRKFSAFGAFCVRFFASLSVIHRGQLTRWRVLESLLALNPTTLKAVPFYFSSKKVTHFSSCGWCRCLFFVVNSVSMTLPYSLSGEAASPLCVRSLCVCNAQVGSMMKYRPCFRCSHTQRPPQRHMLASSASLRKNPFARRSCSSHPIAIHAREPSPRLEHVTRAPSRQSLDRLEWRTLRSRRRQKSFRLMLQHVNRIPCDLLAASVGVLERPHSIHRKVTLKLNFSASVYFYLIKAVMFGSDEPFIKIHYVMDA